MHSTWNADPSARSFRPTTSATRPPMPASTSSKIRPGADVARRPVGGVAEAVPRRRGQRLDGEHDPRQLAAGHDPRQRAEVLARVRRHEELGRVDAAGASTPSPAALSAEPHLEPRALHRQLREQRFEPLAPASVATRRRAVDSRRAASRIAGARAPQAPARARRSDRRLARDRSSSRRSASRRAMTSASAGPYFRFSRSSSASRSSTCWSLAGDASMPVGVRAQKQREVLELRFDAVAGVEIRLELRIERRQLRHPPPDAAQPRQNRVVAFVQGRRSSRCRAARRARRSPAPGGARRARHPRRVLPARWAAGRRDPARQAERRSSPAARHDRRPRRASARAPPATPRIASNAAAAGASSGSSAPKASRTARWVDGSSRVWCSCWPCSSIRRDDRSFSAPAVASVAVDEGAAAALRGDLAPHQQLFPAAVENRLDGGRVLAGAHQVARTRVRQAGGRPPPRGSTSRRRFRRSGRSGRGRTRPRPSRSPRGA